ncbi:MAG: hypothetical protein KBH99_07065 [Syntrophobacteraceae bacterium]|nr:hypothetical protein [Syntrophobacteraceae bacterium]
MRRYTVEVKGKQYVIDVQELSADRFRVILDDQVFEVHLSADQDLAEARITPQILPARAEDEAAIERPTTSYHPPHPDSLEKPPSVPTPPLPPKPHLPGDEPRREITAPMPGVILSVEVQPGDEIRRGQTVVILEAMKMKNPVKSPRDGLVAEVMARPGQSVGYGDVLVRFEEGRP